MLANRVSASQAIDFLHLVQNLKVSRSGAWRCLSDNALQHDVVSMNMLSHSRLLLACRHQRGRDGSGAM